MAAPFILPGMLFHQDLDPKGLEWDDEILENRLIPYEHGLKLEIYVKEARALH